ncbi:hypothetical protein J2T37_002166 [Neisseria perflava]|nr:hypothetical protein [Neisseria perflava]
MLLLIGLMGVIHELEEIGDQYKGLVMVPDIEDSKQSIGAE